MNSKSDRLSSSIDNLLKAIDYYLKDIRIKSSQNKVSKKEFIKIVKDLTDIKNIIISLNNYNIVNHKMDEIRRINLSIKSLYEEDDYNELFNELMKTNNNLFKVEKEKDRKRLSDLKKRFNNLTNFYKYRLSKAEIDNTGNLKFRDKGLDNIKFILEYYLSIKYNFKKIKYETLEIDDTIKTQIDDCKKIIESNNENYIKNACIVVMDCIKKCAESEIIIKQLKKICDLCDSEEYSNIKLKVEMMIAKYKRLFEENKEKYKLETQELNKKSKSTIIDENLYCKVEFEKESIDNGPEKITLTKK